jgi:hypothetical protein
MFGWAGIHEEWASVLISYTPQCDTWNLMYSKTAQGKIFKQHDLLLFNACLGKSIVSHFFLEQTSLYMRDFENGGVGWATTSLSRFFCMHAQMLLSGKSCAGGHAPQSLLKPNRSSHWHMRASRRGENLEIELNDQLRDLEARVYERLDQKNYIAFQCDVPICQSY